MRINKALWKGSIILLFTFGCYNVLNFIFHFSMARLLNIADYGVLATLLSMMFILAVFTDSIQTIIAKYSSEEKEDGKIRRIIFNSLKQVSVWACLVYVFYLLVSIILASTFQIGYPILALSGTIIFFSFLLPVTRGIMQGKKKFYSLGGNLIIESFSKVIIGISLVLIGVGIYGAILGTLLGASISLLVSFLPLSRYLRAIRKDEDVVKKYPYKIQTFTIILILTIFYNLDIILARALFTAEIAGTYAIASILSKIIFWGTQPISRAMLPISSEEKEDKKNTKNTLMNSFAILAGLLVIALIVFYSFSDLIVFIFSGKLIPEASAILFYLGAATALLSITNLILLYDLSINKIKHHAWLAIFVLIEIGLMYLFRESLFQYSLAFLGASIIFLIGTALMSYMNKAQ